MAEAGRYFYIWRKTRVVIGMLKLGCHLSSSKGYLAMGKDALRIGANTFQFFTRNPRGSSVKKIDSEDAQALQSLLQEHDFAKLLGHAPYTLNPCSADARVREFALMVLAEDLANLEFLPGNFYNFHPGSHVGQGSEAGILLIVEALNACLKPSHRTMVLLETMSGKGSEVGSSFEELAQIIDGVALKEKLGVCLDTCHIYSAGYDLVNDLDGVLEEFDRLVGLERLQAIHLNDSLTPFASRKDRHAKIGEGSIGLAAILRILEHPLLETVPFYLETPQDDLDGYGAEIRMLRQSVLRD